MAEDPGDSAVQRLQSGTSTLKRSGPWKVSTRLHVASLTGAVKLDFREAALPGGPIDVEIESGTGAIDLILPAGATADVSGLVAGTGRVRSAVPSQPTSASAHFVVHGLAATGAVRLGYRPRRFGLF